jgi:muramoyltetrapeptide carboxypeptidase
VDRAWGHSVSSMAKLIKPKRLRADSQVAVIAPAGPPRPERLKRGIDLLKKHGYNLRVYPQVRRRRGYLAGDDKARAQALMEAFADKSIDAIFAARGGFGCQRLLPYIDFKIIKANPKPLVGYSDLTVLLLSVYKECGMVTFHGPMASIDFGSRPGKFITGNFYKALESKEPIGIIPKAPKYKYGSIHGGKTEGAIVGGNLSLISRMVGTGFLPSFKDKIVFWEDTDEQPYRIDSYLAQLFQATDFSEAKGFIIGEITNSKTRGQKSESLTMTQVLKDYFGALNKPVITGYPCGHGDEKVTIPIGVKAAIDADKKILEIMEAGVI